MNSTHADLLAKTARAAVEVCEDGDDRPVGVERVRSRLDSIGVNADDAIIIAREKGVIYEPSQGKLRST